MNEGYDIWHGEPIGILSPITLRLLHGTDGSRLTSHKCPGYIATYGNEKNKRRQKGMKESCTSGLLGCQDISSFTGICCCCCLASLYRVMEIPNVAVVVGRVCLASTGLMDQPSHVKNASFLPTTDYTPTLLIIRA